ncbi:MAG TPA: hypothetical protein DIV86_02130 [Alphaproteobacteria bacterium]|nr:hypothetical protein [Alphaproteobacteria bacterium]
MLHDPKFWVAVSSTIFFIAAFKPIKNAIAKMINDRIVKIKSDIEEAALLKKEALELLHEAETKLASVEIQAKGILTNAQEQADLIVKNTQEKLAKDIETRKNIALQKIKSLEESAVEEIKKKVSSVTLFAVQTIAEENLDEETLDRLSIASIEKLPKNFH